MSDQYTLKGDVYNFGVVMLDLLTSHKPFERIWLTSMSTGHKLYERGLQHTSCAENKGKIVGLVFSKKEEFLWRRCADMVHTKKRWDNVSYMSVQ
ncbi:hypothetical protein FRX31_007809 [Thalictrum thalictroides]|uniref:Uncharacterized protein n=1 Tax=Thalictrum thalictroides TaxID=46969 RepID=A0A7J6WYW2_THATH|nr:hypothetical protein FRX31_007809 [Thalictrum thalictroides]